MQRRGTLRTAPTHAGSPLATRLTTRPMSRLQQPVSGSADISHHRFDSRPLSRCRARDVKLIGLRVTPRYFPVSREENSRRWCTGNFRQKYTSTRGYIRQRLTNNARICEFALLIPVKIRGRPVRIRLHAPPASLLSSPET
jgi:hypothetical protein